LNIICPYCETELELSESEISTKKFRCPECMSFLNFNFNPPKVISGEDFTEQAIQNIMRDICPLCGKNKSTNALLSIGYRRRSYSDFEYRVFYIKYKVSKEELSYKINICAPCGNEYLKICKSRILFLFHQNPSKKVLQGKPGYIRGIKFPFEKWNLTVE